MLRIKRTTIRWAVATVGLAWIVLGWLLWNVLLMAAGAVGLCWVTIWLLRGKCAREPAPADRACADAPPATHPVPASAAHQGSDPNDVDALVEQMLAQHRYALLVRPQVAGNLNGQQFSCAIEALQQGMALVPDGDVVLGILGQIDDTSDDNELDNELDEEEIEAHAGRVVRVQRLFLDRHLVTNRQYYEFVAGGGYEQVCFWDESIWPAVLDFVDRSGMPSPRYWKNGCYLQDQENHPVVGVSWYEAVAYARWVGKRLPSDAEWVKAGSWPVPISDNSCCQRKYPWGDSMDRSRVNLWGSGPGSTVPVDQLPEGVSVGGVYQLVGNVWEWTSGNFRAEDHPGGKLLLEVPMKSIRGGAFDTYFDGQATCQFQSGESSISRKHNIGFRLAVGICDLVLAQTGNSPPETAPGEQTGEQTGEQSDKPNDEQTNEKTDQQTPAAEEVSA